MARAIRNSDARARVEALLGKQVHLQLLKGQAEVFGTSLDLGERVSIRGQKVAVYSWQGCLLELTKRGTQPITLGDGSQRKFLEDGDTVVMTAWCEGEGYRVGFGEVTGKVTASR